MGYAPLLGYRGGGGGVVVVKDPMSWFDDKIMYAITAGNGGRRPESEAI